MGKRGPIVWFYEKILLRHPAMVLLCFLLCLGFLGYYTTHFRIEASPETLIQQDNRDFLYYQRVIERYGFEDFVVVTYTPESGNVLDESVLETIQGLQKDIEALDQIDSVMTILDLPLLVTDPRPLSDIIGDMRMLSDPDVTREMMREELLANPMYENLLVSSDMKTTGLQVNFKPDPEYNRLWEQRQQLRQKMKEGKLTPEERAEFQRTQKELDEYRAAMDEIRRHDVEAIRSVLEKYEDDADLFLGGLTIIAQDLMRFIKNDLRIFAGGVLGFLIIALTLIFHRVRWVLLPILCCGFSVLAMIGLLGFFEWPVTIVSANFVALQLIITMAISIHLVVRYRELAGKSPEASNRQLTRDTLISMKTPIFYAGLTTIAGFGSLWFSDILPVETFGWMMVAGIITSLVVTLIFFPASLLLFRKLPPPSGGRSRMALTPLLARFTERHGGIVLVVSAIALVVSAVGISQLRVENSFVNYFKSTTDIYKGLKLIDRELGGTTPLEVIIRFDESSGDVNDADGAFQAEPDTGGGDGFESFDEFSEFEEEETDQDKYWFTNYKLDRIEAVHDYMKQREHSGKVLSLAVLKKIAEDINKGPLDTFEYSLIFSQFPEEYREVLVDPYVSIEYNEARVNLRVKDTHEGLRRNEFLNEIRHDLTEKLGFEEENVRLTGMLVLYNDVLQRLFDSQVLTLGIVLAALSFMFLVLFRSIKIALIAIFPSLLATMFVLGLMGWLNIPLDIMTITIASISVGIAVDDTIHYIHRFKKEMRVDGDYIKAMHRCHGTIGYAIFYTSITIIFGFSILMFSNFVPTIIFGMFTGLAMLIALLAALTLLPRLIILFRPFGEGKPLKRAGAATS